MLVYELLFLGAFNLISRSAAGLTLSFISQSSPGRTGGERGWSAEEFWEHLPVPVEGVVHEFSFLAKGYGVGFKPVNYDKAAVGAWDSHDEHFDRGFLFTDQDFDDRGTQDFYCTATESGDSDGGGGVLSGYPRLSDHGGICPTHSLRNKGSILSRSLLGKGIVSS